MYLVALLVSTVIGLLVLFTLPQEILVRFKDLGLIVLLGFVFVGIIGFTFVWIWDNRFTRE